MPVALVTGGSAGLGRALVTALVGAGWDVVTDARHGERLTALASTLGPRCRAVTGDVVEPRHREQLVAEVAALGPGLDLLVNNASTLGPTPMPGVADLDPESLDDIWLTNVVAPLALTQALLPALRVAGGLLVSISSDAAVEHYEGWGGYAASKAALDHLTLTIAAEQPWLRAYAVDPGDMRTAMHQAAFPGEDIGDRPLPETVVPHLLALVRERPASGRYRAHDLPALDTDAPPGSTPVGVPDTAPAEVGR
jgi:NAD(P)-dependent dehydrogenase (short-subunit alcohol dehydrogenase family)